MPRSKRPIAPDSVVSVLEQMRADLEAGKVGAIIAVGIQPDDNVMVYRINPLPIQVSTLRIIGALPLLQTALINEFTGIDDSTKR